MAKDRQTIARLLRETIVQLCRANSLFGGGRVEVDGIICISGQVEGQELVVKVHEILHEPSADHPLPGATAFGGNGGFFGRDQFALSYGDHQSTSAPDICGDSKRRRLSLGFDAMNAMPPPPPPPPSVLYTYLSRMGYDPLRVGSFASSTDMEFRGGVKDLSMKSTISPSTSRIMSTDARSPSPTPPRRRGSPLCDDFGSLSESFGSGDERLRLSGHKRAAAVMSASSSSFERWSPNRPIPTVPQCILCGYRFDNAEALGEHNESAHSIFTCLCCFKTFTSRSNLERHSRLHTGHRPYVCPVCNKTFSRKDHLSNHATKHAYKCGTCTRRCADRLALAEHYRLEHAGTALAAVCAYCNKGFGSVDSYEDHVKVHPQFHAAAAAAGESGSQYPDDRPPSSNLPPALSRRHCQICGYEASDRLTLLHHQRIAHVTTLMRDAYDSMAGGIQQDGCIFKCSVCGQVCSTLLGLRQHEALHIYELADASRNSVIDFSNLGSTSTMDDNRRMSPGIQQQRELFSCRHCDREFETYVELHRHLRELAAATDYVSVAGQHRDKRKQKQPKPLIAVENVHEAEDEEEVNVVSPASPVNARQTAAAVAMAADMSVPEEEAVNLQVNRNSLCKMEPEQHDEPADAMNAEIKTQPIRTIMNRSSRPASRSRGRRRYNSPAAASLRATDNEGIRFAPISDSGEAAIPGVTSEEVSGNWRSRRRGREGVKSSPCLPTYIDRGSELDEQSERSASALPQSSPDDINGNNNNNGSVKNENMWMSSAASPSAGPHSCVVCGLECAGFADMEAHCITEHSRSPCMFCTKTFAQKANRDRHVCLHTGDRPYGCPECGERFSRGDKLKMHRVRTHGVLYPLYGPRGGHRGGGGDRESRNRSSSQSPSMFAGDVSSDMCSTGGATHDGEPTLMDQSATESHSPPADAEPDVHNGSVASWNSTTGGAADWIDLRTGGTDCTDTSSVIQSVWNSVVVAAPRFSKLADDVTEGAA